MGDFRRKLTKRKIGSFLVLFAALAAVYCVLSLSTIGSIGVPIQDSIVFEKDIIYNSAKNFETDGGFLRSTSADGMVHLNAADGSLGSYRYVTPFITRTSDIGVVADLRYRMEGEPYIDENIRTFQIREGLNRIHIANNNWTELQLHLGLREGMYIDVDKIVLSKLPVLPDYFLPLFIILAAGMCALWYFFVFRADARNTCAIETDGRNNWIDTLRFLACVWVALTHLWAAGFRERGSDFFLESDTAEFILTGFTGKFAVVVFCVLLGYFACGVGAKNKIFFGRYCVSRYFQFVLNLLIANLLALLLAHVMQANLHAPHEMFRSFLRDSFFFGSHLLPANWPMKDFFLASLFCFAQGFLSVSKFKGREVLLIGANIAFAALLCYLGNLWLAICMLGGFVCIIQQTKEKYKILDKPILHILLVPVIIFLFRRPGENDAVFLLQGIAVSLFLLVCFNNRILQKIPGSRLFGKLGACAFYFYLLHAPAQRMILPFAAELKDSVSINIAFAVCFSIELLVVICFSLLMDTLNRKCLIQIPKWFWVDIPKRL